MGKLTELDVETTTGRIVVVRTKSNSLAVSLPGKVTSASSELPWAAL